MENLFSVYGNIRTVPAATCRPKTNQVIKPSSKTKEVVDETKTSLINEIWNRSFSPLLSEQGVRRG